MCDEALIARLKGIYPDRDLTNFTPLDYLHAYGSPLEALAYARLLWPDFVVVDDMVFLKDCIEDEDDRRRVREAYVRYGQDREETERAFNTIETEHLFGARVAEVTEAMERGLAEVLVACWRARLAELFPERRFVVEVYEPTEDDDSIGVVFYQA